MRKVLIPYLVWSIAALAVSKSLSVGGIVKGILFGAASAQMYYLLVYAQLVLLTPVFYKLLRSHRALVYAATPVFLLVREVAALLGVALPQVQVLFPAWMIYYAMGLDWERLGVAARRAGRALPVALLVCLVVQEIVGFSWLHFGDYNMATTQLKLSSMAGSIVAALIIGVAGSRLRAMIARGWLVTLGDASFGIYLCHLLVLMVVGKVVGLVVAPLLVVTILKWVLTLGMSCAIVRGAIRFLPRRLCDVLGFV